MTATNDITKARLTTGVPSEQYKNNYDRIFGKKQENSNGEDKDRTEGHGNEGEEERKDDGIHKSC